MPVPAVAGLTGFEEIGRGGFGIVYRAHQEALGRDVAVKVLPGVHEDSLAFARFERECKALGSVGTHPNIATVYGCGVTSDGDGYLAMELLEGGSLADRIAAGPMPWPEVARIGVALSGALESAHRLGVLHRDVKPANVLFDRLGTAKLLDFGIASVPGAYQTRTSAVSVTLAHAAPEITAGGRATVSSDVYALGSTLWTAIAGSAPFVRDDEDTLVPLLARIAAAPVPDLPGDDVPPVLSALLAKSLAKDALGRPASAEELGTGLAYVLRSAGETVDGPAVLTALTRVPSALALEAQSAEAAERTLSRSSAVAALPLGSEDEAVPQQRRRQLVAAAVVGALLLFVSGLAVVSMFGSGGGPVQADAESLHTAAPSSSPSRSPAPRHSAPAAHPSAHSSAASPSHRDKPSLPSVGTSTGPITRVISVVRSPSTSSPALQHGPPASHSAPATSSPVASSPPSSSTPSPTPSLSSSSPSPSPSPTTSPPPPPLAPGPADNGAVRMVRRNDNSIQLALAWGAPSTGGPVTSYVVRRTLMHGGTAQGQPVVLGPQTTRQLQVSAPLIQDTLGWFRWQVRARGPGGVSSWHLLSVHLVNLTGHGCSPSVLGMRAAGLSSTAVRKGSGKTFHVSHQSLGAGNRRPGRALVLTCVPS